MAPKNKNILLQLIDRHHKLGIVEQIDYDKIYLRCESGHKPGQWVVLNNQTQQKETYVIASLKNLRLIALL